MFYFFVIFFVWFGAALGVVVPAAAPAFVTGPDVGVPQNLPSTPAKYSPSTYIVTHVIFSTLLGIPT
jgi:hypothetical protein